MVKFRLLESVKLVNWWFPRYTMSESIVCHCKLQFTKLCFTEHIVV